MTTTCDLPIDLSTKSHHGHSPQHHHQSHSPFHQRPLSHDQLQQLQLEYLSHQQLSAALANHPLNRLYLASYQSQLHPSIVGRHSQLEQLSLVHPYLSQQNQNQNQNHHLKLHDLHYHPSIQLKLSQSPPQNGPLSRESNQSISPARSDQQQACSPSLSVSPQESHHKQIQQQIIDHHHHQQQQQQQRAQLCQQHTPSSISLLAEKIHQHQLDSQQQQQQTLYPNNHFVQSHHLTYGTNGQLSHNHLQQHSHPHPHHHQSHHHQKLQDLSLGGPNSLLSGGSSLALSSSASSTSSSASSSTESTGGSSPQRNGSETNQDDLVLELTTSTSNVPTVTSSVKIKTSRSSTASEIGQSIGSVSSRSDPNELMMNQRERSGSSSSLYGSIQLAHTMDHHQHIHPHPLDLQHHLQQHHFERHRDSPRDGDDDEDDEDDEDEEEEDPSPMDLHLTSTWSTHSTASSPSSSSASITSSTSSSSSLNYVAQLGDKKRTNRPLTGKHVKHGTGASIQTLVTLRNVIRQRQMSAVTKILNVMFPPEYIKSQYLSPQPICSLLQVKCSPSCIPSKLSGHFCIVSSEPCSRLMIKNLNAQLDYNLRLHRAKPVGLCPIRRAIYDQCFDEIIRQVTINCVEQGLILLRLRNEIRLSIECYRRAYESGVRFGLNTAIRAKLETETKQAKKQMTDESDQDEESAKLNIQATSSSNELDIKNKLDSVDGLKEFYEAELKNRDQIIEQQRIIIKELSQRTMDEIKGISK